MSLTQLRVQLRAEGRNTNDPSYYTNAFIDAAINRLCARYLRVTRCVKFSTTVNFVATSNEADFSSLSAFLAGRIDRARVDVDTNYTAVYDDLEITDAGSVLDRLACNTSTGTPCELAFVDSTTAKLYPTPSHNGTLTVVYSPLQTPFTIGTMGTWASGVAYVPGDVVISSGTLYRNLVATSSDAVSTTATWANLGAGSLIAPGSISSVIPDGLMTELIGTGGPPMLQRVDSEHQAFVGAAWADYIAFEQSSMGIGSISGKSSGGNSYRSRCR